MMRNSRRFRSSLAGSASAFLAMLALVACNQTQPPAASPKLESKATATANREIYVIFQGPWAIVPDPKDGSRVIALAPKTKIHHDLVVQSADKKLAPGIYELSLPARTVSTTVTVDPNILQVKVDPQTIQHVLDTKSERYAIRLPKPDAYVAATHYRSRTGSAYPPDISTEKDYVTSVSLRYAVATLNGFSLAGAADNGVFNPLSLQVETPILNFAIDPAGDPAPTDQCHTHERQSFHALTKLLNVTVFLDFPNDPSKCHDIDPQNLPLVKSESVPTFPSFLARDFAGDREQHLLAAIFFFGGSSSDCKAPIIVGNG
jgi:hypothetical protein